MLDQKDRTGTYGMFLGKCLTRFCLGTVTAMLYYLQSGQAEPWFLTVVCLLLLPAAGTVFLEKKEEASVLFYGGEALLLLTAILPMVVSWRTGQYEAVERNSLLFGSLVIVVPSVLTAGGFRRNLLDRPLAAEGVLFLSAYLWAVWNEAGYGYRFFLYALSVLFLLLYFYQKNQYGQRSFFEASGGLPAEGQEQYIRQVNRRSLLPFLVLLFFLSALVWIPMGSQALTEALQEPYSNMMESVNEWMTGMPEEFAGMFGEPPQEEKDEEKTEQESGEALPVPVKKEADLWLLKALIQGTMLFLTLLTAGIVFLILRRASEQRGHKSQNEMQEEYELTITEQSVRLERERPRRQRVSDIAPENRRIRQVYQETICRGLRKEENQKGNKVGARQSAMTPKELESSAGLRGKKKERAFIDAAEQLHQLYERARYGREACTKDEQRLAEEAAAQLVKTE